MRLENISIKPFFNKTNVARCTINYVHHFDFINLPAAQAFEAVIADEYSEGAEYDLKKLQEIARKINESEKKNVNKTTKI